MTKSLKEKSQRLKKIKSVKNEDLSREIHEVTARPISHGLAPLSLGEVEQRSLNGITRHEEKSAC